MSDEYLVQTACGEADCDETYSYNDTCVMHLAEYPGEQKCYVCPMPRTVEIVVEQNKRYFYIQKQYVYCYLS